MSGRCAFGKAIGIPVALIGLAGGCAPGIHNNQAPSISRKAAGPVLRPPPGDANYTIGIREINPSGDSTVTVDARVRIGEWIERVDILRATKTTAAGVREFDVPPNCSTAQGDGILALAITRPLDLDRTVPPCVPEPLFGALTDLLNILLVQVDDAFGVAPLRRPGGSARFEPFSVSWHRPPALIAANVSCPGGTTTLISLTEEAAIIRWTPEPMRVTMIRSAPGSVARMLMAGEEIFELELTINPRTGELKSAKSTRDDISMTLWMPFDGEELPDAEELPAAPGMPITLRREVSLRALK